MSGQTWVRHFTVDELAQFIRATDGDNTMGAGALAEKICEWTTALADQHEAPALPADYDPDLPDWLKPGEDERTVQRLRERSADDPDLKWLLQQYDRLENERAMSFADAYDRANWPTPRLGRKDHDQAE